MAVQQFNPSESVTVTSGAAKYIRAQIAKHEGAMGMRVGIKESGCSGFMYVVDYVDQPTEDDVLVEVEGAPIVIAKQHLSLLAGTEIDYIQQGLNKLLHFRNPNAEAECGCGESFSVKK